MNPGIHKIRPKVLFRLIEERFPLQNNAFKVNIPSSEIGGMTLLESSVLVALARLSNAGSLFEFGTFMGASTLLLAENTLPGARIVTLDIDSTQVNDTQADSSKEELILKDGNRNDDFLRQVFNQQGARCIQWAEPHIQQKIQQVLMDSTKIDVEKQGWNRQFDYILIDGGHDLGTIASDTHCALQMIKEDGLIVWHDFESRIHGDVTRFLHNYCDEHIVYHVENTMIAFELFGRHRQLLSQ